MQVIAPGSSMQRVAARSGPAQGAPRQHQFQHCAIRAITPDVGDGTGIAHGAVQGVVVAVLQQLPQQLVGRLPRGGQGGGRRRRRACAQPKLGVGNQPRDLAGAPRRRHAEPSLPPQNTRTRACAPTCGCRTAPHASTPRCTLRRPGPAHPPTQPSAHLVSPVVRGRHADVVQEQGQSLALWRPKCAALPPLQAALHRGLQDAGRGQRGQGQRPAALSRRGLRGQVLLHDRGLARARAAHQLRMCVRVCEGVGEVKGKDTGARGACEDVVQGMHAERGVAVQYRGLTRTGLPAACAMEMSRL